MTRNVWGSRERCLSTIEIKLADSTDTDLTATRSTPALQVNKPAMNVSSGVRDDIY